MPCTQFICRAPLPTGILTKREDGGKVQGTMPSLRPRRASCHSDADLAQVRVTSRLWVWPAEGSQLVSLLVTHGQGQQG